MKILKCLAGMKHDQELPFFLYVIIFLMPFFVIDLSWAVDHKSRAKPNFTSDPRGEPELVVCSQNLNNYGIYRAATSAGVSPEEFAEKQRALIERFSRIKCDVVAVQEVRSNSESEGKEALKFLAKALQERTHRFYEVAVGATNDGNLRNGYLVAKDRAEIANILSYNKVELPKISERQKSRFFARGPLEIQLSVKPKEEGEARLVTLINMHFKSKSGGKGDPTGLEWETYRMEMSEALRRIPESRHKSSFTRGDNILLVLGDRNSNFDLASAKILEGTLSLSNFQGDPLCRLSKRGVPLCKGDFVKPQILFSVLTQDPQTKHQPGSYKYKDMYSWIDEILMPAESLRTAWERFDVEGDFDSGVVYEPKKASDHALVWVRLNW